MLTNLLHNELYRLLLLMGNSLPDGSLQEAMLNRCHLKPELKPMCLTEHQQPNSVSLCPLSYPWCMAAMSNFRKEHILLSIQHQPTKKRPLNQSTVLSKPIQYLDKRSESLNSIQRVPNACRYLQKPSNQHGLQSRLPTNMFAC